MLNLQAQLGRACGPVDLYLVTAGMRSLPLTFPLSSFDALVSSTPRTITQRVFRSEDASPAGLQLTSLPSRRRHELLRSLLLELDRERHTGATFTNADGCDWIRNGATRVVVRSAQLSWRVIEPLKPQGIPDGRWLVKFQQMPLSSDNASVTEVHLALVTPEDVLVYRDGGCLHATSAGRLTAFAGGQLQLLSKAGIRGWRAALELWIIPRLLARGYTPLGHVSLGDPRLVAAASALQAKSGRTDTAFQSAPLATLSPAARRTMVEAIVREVDARLHPGALFEGGAAQKIGFAGGGAPSPQSTAWELSCSWRRDGQRVVCRTAQLTWERPVGRWRFLFSGVRLPTPEDDEQCSERRSQPSFDELLLALYTPRGLEVFQHDLAHGLSRTGVRTAINGYQIKLNGVKGEERWADSLDEAILPKLHASGCKHLASLPWDDH